MSLFDVPQSDDLLFDSPAPAKKKSDSLLLIKDVIDITNDDMFVTPDEAWRKKQMFKLRHFDRDENQLNNSGCGGDDAVEAVELTSYPEEITAPVKLPEEITAAMELPEFSDTAVVCLSDAGDTAVAVVKVEPCPCRFHRRESVLRMKAQAIMLMPVAEPKCHSG